MVCWCLLHVIVVVVDGIRIGRHLDLHDGGVSKYSGIHYCIVEVILVGLVPTEAGWSWVKVQVIIFYMEFQLLRLDRRSQMFLCLVECLQLLRACLQSFEDLCLCKLGQPEQHTANMLAVSRGAHSSSTLTLGLQNDGFRRHQQVNIISQRGFHFCADLSLKVGAMLSRTVTDIVDIVVLVHVCCFPVQCLVPAVQEPLYAGHLQQGHLGLGMQISVNIREKTKLSKIYVNVTLCNPNISSLIHNYVLNPLYVGPVIRRDNKSGAVH